MHLHVNLSNSTFLSLLSFGIFIKRILIKKISVKQCVFICLLSVFIWRTLPLWHKKLIPNFRSSVKKVQFMTTVVFKAYALYFLFFHQMIVLQKLWKILFISLFVLSIFNFLYFRPPLFSPLAIALEDDQR